MAAKRKRRPPHRGVVLVRPEVSRPHVGWRARYRDPDTNKVLKVSLDHSLTTAEQREAWAVAKARQLAKRRVELDNGATRATGELLSKAIERYYKAHPRLKPRTVEVYKDSSDKLVAWAKDAGIATVDELNRGRLVEFREHLVKTPKRAPLAKAKRGKRVATKKPRAAVTVNRELRAVRTVLQYLVDADVFARLNSDDLRRALKQEKVATERAEYLTPAECKELLEAAMRHDVDTVITREEEADIRREAKQRGLSRAAMAALRPKGTTPKHSPITPFVTFLLLSGMRLGEGLALEWKQIDLEAKGHDGSVVGEIHLKGSGTKTNKARSVGLDVSLALHSMLSNLMESSGGKGSVFGMAEDDAKAAAKRLRGTYGAPERFSWQMLRSTCATFLTNAPGIFGAASAYRSAKQLGHSVQVAEKHYLGLVRGIPATARTLEEAMGLRSGEGSPTSVASSTHDRAELEEERS